MSRKPKKNQLIVPDPEAVELIKAHNAEKRDLAKKIGYVANIIYGTPVVMSAGAAIMCVEIARSDTGLPRIVDYASAAITGLSTLVLARYAPQQAAEFKDRLVETLNLQEWPLPPTDPETGQYLPFELPHQPPSSE